MPAEIMEPKSGADSIEAPATGSRDAMVDRDAALLRTDPAPASLVSTIHAAAKVVDRCAGQQTSTQHYPEWKR
jgi:hypothetical protein